MNNVELMQEMNAQYSDEFVIRLVLFKIGVCDQLVLDKLSKSSDQTKKSFFVELVSGGDMVKWISNVRKL